MMTHMARACGALLVLALMAGCATNRGYMKLDVSSAAPAPTSAATKAQPIVIDSVQDHRQFQESPSDPSIPSLKKGDNYKLDAEQRKRAIARKRNSWGRALGDILLDGNDTVETLARGLVEQGLRAKGYQVLPAGSAAPADAIHVQVDVAEFWAWFTPGMWTVDMEAKVRTQVKLAGGKQFEVYAYGKKSAPSGREDNWRQAYERAFAEYEAKFAEGAGGAGL